MCTNGINTSQLSVAVEQVDGASGLLEKDAAAQTAVEVKLV